MHDIAREAGVSIATVSRVINNPDTVEESTRQRVLDVIRLHDYTPNALARSLLANRTRSIGVLTVDILNPYYATIVHAIERILSAQGNSILLCNTGGSHLEKARYIRTLLEKRVDGLIFVGSVYREKDGAEDILAAARSLPVVMINSIIDARNIYCVLCDDKLGIRQGVDHVISGGKRDLLFLNTTTTSSARLKEKEYLRLLDSYGFDASDRRIVETSPERLRELPGVIAETYGEKKFNAVLASDDLFANVAVNTLHSMHLRIPEDVWVIGYNNSYLSDQTFPQLTSIDSRMTDLAESASSILSDVLSGVPIAEQVRYLEPELVIKGSTG
jgi:LacI family transcriptional regulator